MKAVRAKMKRWWSMPRRGGPRETAALWTLAAVFIFSIRELTRHGVSHDYLFLFLGSAASFESIRRSISRGDGGRPARRMDLFYLLFAWMPWVFGGYLVSYRGFWRLTEMLEGFSWVILLKAACFILAGAVILAGTCFPRNRVQRTG